MPWYYGWNVLGVGMVFQAATFGITFYCFTFWVGPWTRDFGVSRSDVMLLILVTQVAMGVVAPLAGRAMDALSIRALVITGATAYALGLAIAAQASALWHIGAAYATLLVAGVSLAGPLAAQTLAAKWFFGRRGTAIGIVSVGTSVGGFVLPLLVTFLLARYGWRDTHMALAVLVFVAVVPLVWWVVRSTPQDKGVEPEPDRDTQSGLEVTFPRWSVRAVLRERAFWVTVFAFAPMMTAFGAVQQNLAPYTADLGIDIQATSVLVSIMAVVMIAGKVFFGAAADRWDHRFLYWLAAGILLGTLVLMTRAPNYASLLVIVALLGFSAGGFLPLLGAIVGSRFGPASFGLVMGLLGPFTTVAATGPWIAGYVRDTAGSYDPAWVLFMWVIVPAAIAMGFMSPRPVGALPEMAS